MLSALTSRAIIGEFYNRLAQSTGVPWVDAISMKFTSNQAQEVYEQLGQANQMSEWVGGKTAKSLRVLGNITVINIEYEATLSVLRQEIRRDKTTQVQLRINDQVRRALSHDAKILTDLLETGQTALCQDGQSFFDTDHVEGDNTTNQDNDLTTDIAVPAAPTAVEMETAVMDMVTKIISYKDDVNEPMNEDAKEFLVMVPTNMLPAAAAALRAPIITDSSGSKTNVIQTIGDWKLNLIANARLTADDEMYVFRTDTNGTKAFIKQEEVPLTIEDLVEGSDEAFHNKRHLFSIWASKNVAFGMWQHAVFMKFT